MDAMESLEQTGKVVLGDSKSVIDDRQSQSTVHLGGTNPNFASIRRVLNSIG